MKTVSVKLPPDLANWLTRRAKGLGRSQSDLVRTALERDRLQNAARPNCRDLLADIGGFFDGPKDLSTNSKYLDDYGK